jgi:hypothetical protein
VTGTEQTPLTEGGFVPTGQDTAELMAWFAEYDALAARGDVQHLRYADVMVKSGGAWRFTSMIQAGWGDVLKQFAQPLAQSKGS